MIKKKVTESEITRDGFEEFDEEIEEETEETSQTFDPERFVNRSVELMKTHSERLKGIIMNIRNANIIPKEQKTESHELENIFRNIEIDCIQQFDEVENYQRELINYPRSITYYQAKIDDQGRGIIESLAGYNEQVRKFIFFYEPRIKWMVFCNLVFYVKSVSGSSLFCEFVYPEIFYQDG